MSDEPPLLPPPEHQNGNRRFAIRVIVLALAAIVIGELTITVGRGIVCSMKGGCASEEWAQGGELLSGLIATLVALLFGLLGNRKP
jgi:hypothetical protein